MQGENAIAGGYSRRLHVALVAPPYFEVPPDAYGGVEAVVADLADGLVAAGHQVTLLGAGRSNTSARFIPLWDSAIPDKMGQAVPELTHAVKARRAIRRLLAEGLDIVHDHTSAGPLNAAGYRELGVPSVVTVHGVVGGLMADYYRDLGNDVGLVSISDRQRGLTPDLNWIGRVHNGLRVEDWPLRIRKDDYALFLGRFSPDKGPDLALEAAHAAGVPLVLAGKCVEALEIAGFRDRVLPLMRSSDYLFGQADSVAKRRLLAGARCLVLPLRWEEPFGMVMIEAMACGTPVVALNRGAAAEIIVDGVTGFLCDEPSELAEGIQRASGLDPGACRRHVEVNFNNTRMARGYERMYRNVLTAHLSASRPAGLSA